MRPLDRVSPITGDKYKLPTLNESSALVYYCVEIQGTVAQALMPSVTCRDYILDYFIDDIDFTAADRRYGVAPDDGKLTWEGPLTLAIGYWRTDTLDKFMPQLHKLEDKWGVPRTQMFETNHKHYRVIIADEYYKRSSLHMSWFLQLLRTMACLAPAYDTMQGAPPTHLLNCPTYWGTFWTFGDLLSQVPKGKRFRNHENRQHGINGYYSFWYATHQHCTQPELYKAYIDAFGKNYHYFNQLFALQQKQKPCAASPATAS